MLDTDLTFFAFAIPSVVFAGVSKAGFGSGAAFASASILALILEPGQALALMLPLLMLIDLASLGPYWGRWNGAAARVLILGGIPGVALGAGLYQAVDDDTMRVLIGGISVGFVLWQLTKTRFARTLVRGPMGTGGGAIAGVVAGFASFVSHAGGPPAAVYLLSRNLDKTEYQATTVLVFWAINIAKFIPYAFLGMFTLNTMWVDLMLAPFALIGTWIGVHMHRLVSDRVFFALTYVLLTVTGAKLIWDGLM
ncbi:sulfite exporter TauE/SafE family protein [Rhodobacteraceae bacterium M382]|nr:sulfite exporter TauE/SafE family protein [Rhodobacteraceae bacterium M382]